MDGHAGSGRGRPRSAARALTVVLAVVLAVLVPNAPANAAPSVTASAGPADCSWYATAAGWAQSAVTVDAAWAQVIRDWLAQAGGGCGGSAAATAPQVEQPPAEQPQPTAPQAPQPQAPQPQAPQPQTPEQQPPAQQPPAEQPVPSGGAQVCDTFGSAPVAGGRYVVQNNVWGSGARQCVRAFDTGFEVQEAQFSNQDGPASYPSIFTGCHYGNCTAGTALPKQVGALPPVTSSWSVTVPRPEERWTAAYDIWFDPTPRTDGRVTGTELMIWIDRNGPQPIGENTGTVDIAGATWEVWRGDNGAQVVSYVRTNPTRAVQGLPLSAFFADAVGRGAVGQDWYLTSIQAGFEPWTGGQGLTTTSFSVDGVTN